LLAENGKKQAKKGVVRDKKEKKNKKKKKKKTGHWKTCARQKNRFW